GGTTTGVLSFGSTLSLAGTTTFDFNGATRGSGFDGINVTGALTNGGGLVLNFSTTLTGGTYDLFALGSQSGDFASVTLTGLGYGAGSLVNSSGTWTGNIGGSDFTYVQSTGDLTISSVPEPSTFAALAGIAVLGLATLRRRRNA
ncbi:MAG: PEP-CTERM sorting domain-containing protein, partial [Opitutaceae bacterium]|nr:PEP-CTERM sorting domain-containing protein [Opitutaceae bacterium]